MKHTVPDTFQSFLDDKFWKDNPTCLDDDSPDAFDDWLCDLDPDTLIKYAEMYSKFRYNQGFIHGMARAQEIIDKFFEKGMKP